MTATVAAYEKGLEAGPKAVCVTLRRFITSAMPEATSKVWHGSPVWFIGENPVVGYTARPSGVVLLFWNGQSFGEPALEAIGSFHAAQVRYPGAVAIDAKLLARWLEKAKTDIWDSVAYRRRALAKAKRGKTAPRRSRAK
jgi:hypothetical protein